MFEIGRMNVRVSYPLLPWTRQGSTLRTVMSFLNYTQYSPSLDYMPLTMGIGLLLLAQLESM